MAFDPTLIAPEEKVRLRRIGASFGSSDALAQADVTLKYATKHISILPMHGFGPVQLAQLEDARAASIAQGVQRADTRTGRKVTKTALLDAMFAGKSVRMRARTIYTNARGTLAAAGNQPASVRTIDSVLAATSSAGSDSDELATQMQQLQNLLTDTAIRGAVGEEVATALETDLRTRRDALLIARGEGASTRGTPTDTDLIDLIDGVIVELVRAARRAARSAARELGQPAIADELQLNELYHTTGRAPKTPSTPATPPTT